MTHVQTKVQQHKTNALIPSFHKADKMGLRLPPQPPPHPRSSGMPLPQLN